MKNFHCKTINQTLIELNSNKNGLNVEEVQARFSTSPAENNFIKKQSILIKFFQQFFVFKICL